MFTQKSTKLSTIMLALILGASVFMAGQAWAVCGFSSEAAKKAGPQYGGSITFLDGFGAAFPPTAWHQGEGSSWTASIYHDPMYETLLANDTVLKGPCGTGESEFYHSNSGPLEVMTGKLAERWELPDPQTLVWYLRRGILWAGKPGVMKSRELVAEDIVKSYELGWKRYPGVSTTKEVVSMTAKDRYTVVLMTKQLKEFELAFGTQGWLGNGIVPAEVGDEAMKDWKTHVGLGTGPFFLEDFVEGSYVSYVRNPNYWNSYVYNDKKYEIPFIDRLVKTLIKDKSSQVAALRTGKIDVYDVLEKKFVDSVKRSAPEIKMRERVAERAWRMGFRLDVKPFDDLRVRRAMSMAIDREAFIKTIQGGKGEILNAEIHSGHTETFYTPLEKMPKEIQENFSYNPELARKLLAEAGYPNGFETTIQANAREPERDVVSFLAAMWKDIGIDVKIDLREASVLNGILVKNEHAPLTFLANSVMLAGATLQTYTMDESNTYQVNVVDDLEINEASENWVSEPDPVKANKILKDWNVLWHKKVYNAYLPTPYVSVAYWPWVENYAGEVNESSSMSVGGIFARAWVNSDLKAKIQ